MNISSGLEEDLFQRRMQDLEANHPEHARMTQALLRSVDYDKATIKNPIQMRGMLLSLGIKLAAEPMTGLLAWQSWLERLATDGALHHTEARELIAQAQALANR